MNVVFCSSEVFPFVKTGGLADVCGALPIALEDEDVKVSIFLPRYGVVKPECYRIERVADNCLKTRLGKNVDVYLVEHSEYFGGRDGVYGFEGVDYPDNLDRFSTFCHDVLGLIQNLKIDVDIFHCHDWQTALIPVLLKEKYQDQDCFKKTKTILTIHNLAYQGVFSSEEYVKLGLREDLFGMNGFEFYGKVNFLKAGLLFADEITTVSPRYSKEIQTKEFGCGLDDVLVHQADHIYGILNGLDYDVWNPSTDPLIRKKYDGDFETYKTSNKESLQELFSLPLKNDVPIFGFVARLSHQKGVDLLINAMKRLSEMNLQVVVQGIGDESYHQRLMQLQKEFPHSLGVCLAFDERAAHQIYAGSDFFLMPSCFEPCGLSQLISLKYGTIPVVYETGGLADTVQPLSSDQSQGTGFLFSKYNEEDFIDCIRRACETYQQKNIFEPMVERAMKENFSWEKSAQEYKRVYECLLSA